MIFHILINMDWKKSNILHVTLQRYIFIIYYNYIVAKY